MTSARTKIGGIAVKGLTPLLDTLFILLLALLALSDTKRSAMEDLVRINLPKVEPSQDAPAAEKQRVSIEIGADSIVRMGEAREEVRSRSELDAALARAIGASAPEELIVDIQADRDARHGVAVELLQHLRLRGFASVNLLAVGASSASDPFGGPGAPR